MNFFRPAAIVVAALGALHVVPAFAQEPCKGKAEIYILEDKTNLPVPGAMVSVGDLQTAADIHGYCLLVPVCAGKTHLHVEALGYKTIDKDVVISNNQTLTLRLKPSGITLDAVEVTGHKQALSTTASVTTLSKKELDRNVGGSLANAIQSITGVSMLQTGATIAKPIINGMHSNRILVLNNGIRQEGQQWGSEHAPEIDPFIAQNISVVKGAEAIRYGAQAIGGVVLVDPPALPTDSAIHGRVNAVGASNGRMGAVSGMLNGNFKKMPAFAWRVQGTAKRGGNYKAANYFLDNTGIKELDYSAGLGYSKKHFDATVFYSHFNTEIGIFKGSEIGSIEDLETRIANGRPFDEGHFSYDIAAPKQQVKHDLLKVKAHVHINDYLHLNAQYGFQHDGRQEYDVRLGGRTVLPVLDLSLNTQTLDLSLDYFDGKQWKATFGASGSYEQNKNVPGTFTTPLIPDYIAQNMGVFAIGKWIKTDFQLEAGVRYDYKYLNALGYDLYQNLYGGTHYYSNASGSLGAIWSINPALNLNTNVGTAWRAPEVNELYSNGLHDGAAAYEIGDSNLKTEKSLKWITTLEYRNPHHWLNIDLDLYAQYFDDYIYLNPADTLWESLRGAFPTFNYKQTNARFLGADLTAQLFFLKHFEYTLKGSLIRAKDISNNRFLPLIPADKIVQSIQWKYDPVSFLHDTYLQFSHTYVARQNRYEPSSDYAPPPDAYQLLKISLGTTFQLKKQSLNVDFSINNLANTEYKDYMDRYRYYAHDLGRNYELRLAYHF